MPMTSRDPASAAPYDAETLAFYQRNARSYSSARPDEAAPELLAFLPRLAPGSRILELGCGSGCDAAAMIALGFDVDATDGTAAMVALASERLGRAVRLLRFDDLASRNEYDAVVASASLLHVPYDRLSSVIERVWTALKPGGWHFASYKTGGAPGRDIHDRYYNHLSRDGAGRCYRGVVGWADIAFDEYDGIGYFSAPCRWLTVTARKEMRGRRFSASDSSALRA